MKNPFAGTWMQMVTFSGLVHDITKIELVKMACSFFLGAAFITLVRAFEHMGPVVRLEVPAEVSSVIVHGTSVKVHIHLYENRESCNGSYVVRRMVRYADAKLTIPTEVAFFQERDVPWGKIGQQDFTLDLTLYQKLTGDGWHFYYERVDNCGLLDDLFPHHPVSAPPHPAIIEN
jgi:hypothetical protein